MRELGFEYLFDDSLLLSLLEVVCQEFQCE